MPLARLYDQHATECARSAEKAEDPKRRALLLKIADEWPTRRRTSYARQATGKKTLTQMSAGEPFSPLTRPSAKASWTAPPDPPDPVPSENCAHV
jgi:hypothetical protein